MDEAKPQQKAVYKGTSFIHKQQVEREGNWATNVGIREVKNEESTLMS